MDQKEKLKVVLFSGGSGTGSITDALLKYPDIDLTMLVNAYDDGKSTGLLRRFIPGMLGPSDVRKVVSSLLKHQSDRSSQALRQLLEHRLPDTTTTEEALELLAKLIDWRNLDTSHKILAVKEDLSLAMLRDVSRFLDAFLTYYRKTSKTAPWFTFADNSLGNLLFGGCYLMNNQNFNQAIQAFSAFAEVRGVVNITYGENLVLTALKENGRYLADEAAIVSPQDPVKIEEIFLLPHAIDSQEVDTQKTKSDKIIYLRRLETPPRLNPEADAALREADIIVYGPGTQHSSLYPSYLTVGVAEAILSNKRAEKIFIANIARDHDILAASAATLVQGFMANMSRKGSVAVKNQQLITRFFFQKPDTGSLQGADYVPFEADTFEYPLEKVVWIDLEGATGKHSGGRTVSELLLVVEEQLRKKIRHVPHKVSIIIPALNEQKTIRQVVREVRALQFPDLGLEKEIIVVDGGSTDDTFNLIQEEVGIRSYQLAGKGGRGAAFRVGLEKARGEIVVFFPSDGEYAASDIIRIVTPLLNQEFPVVFGSRAFQSHDLSGTLHRIYGSKGLMFTASKYGGMLLSVMTLLLYHRYISDPLTSLKGFNARVFRGLEFRRTGVDFDMELIGKLARAKYTMLEIPVSYKARTAREGKKITIGDGIKCLITLLRFSRRRHRPNRTKPVTVWEAQDA